MTLTPSTTRNLETMTPIVTLKGSLKLPDIGRIFDPETNPTGDSKSPSFFIIDRLPAKEKGVLLVETDDFGMMDALRLPREEIRHGVQTDSEFSADAQYPKRVFAVYDLTSGQKDADSKVRRTEFQSIVHRLECGMAYYDHDFDECDVSAFERPRHRNLYVGTPGNGKTLEQLKTDHAVIAGRENVDKTMFAVVDGDYEEMGLLFVRVGDSTVAQDEFRHRGKKTGELLYWMHIGFFDRDEAKAEEVVEWPEDTSLDAMRGPSPEVSD
ncbi:MAG: hypothetical protein Q9227_009261 [Pyrenula ochraceoflavens]